ATTILVQVCNALSEAHGLGIIHRDLKPENIRIGRTRDGYDFVKVLDFGLAKMVKEEPVPSITAKGHVVGTPYYMAPEQIRGEEVDSRSDIYSLGAIAYRMFTGQQVFTAKTPLGVLTKHITENPTPPSLLAKKGELQTDADDFVLKALAKCREDRYSDADEMRQAIYALAEKSLNKIIITPNCTTAVKTTFRRETDSEIAEQDVDIELVPPGPMDLDAITEQRLSREDLAFERRLRRNRALAMLLFTFLLGGIGFVSYWFLFEEKSVVAPIREQEPNNSADQATLLEPGKPVAGKLGKRIGPTESDRDWYRFSVAGPENQVLKAQVSRIPNMDIVLELFDHLGQEIISANSSGIGGPETITNWRVHNEEYFLLVREIWESGVSPTENVTDTYRLHAELTHYFEGWEKEPNDNPDQANPIQIDTSTKAFLGAARDRDFFILQTNNCQVSGEVSALPGVDLLVTIKVGTRKLKTFNRGKIGDPETFDQIKIKGQESLLIQVRRKNQAVLPTGQAPASLTVPYVLKIAKN
ncbi:MAG: serine/threonine-protein kinase, partial [Pseudomonadota bacterium]